MAMGMKRFAAHSAEELTRIPSSFEASKCDCFAPKKPSEEYICLEHIVLARYDYMNSSSFSTEHRETSFAHSFCSMYFKHEICMGSVVDFPAL